MVCEHSRRERRTEEARTHARDKIRHTITPQHNKHKHNSQHVPIGTERDAPTARHSARTTPGQHHAHTKPRHTRHLRKKIREQPRTCQQPTGCSRQQIQPPARRPQRLHTPDVGLKQNTARRRRQKPRHGPDTLTRTLQNTTAINSDKRSQTAATRLHTHTNVVRRGPAAPRQLGNRAIRHTTTLDSNQPQKVSLDSNQPHSALT